MSGRRSVDCRYVGAASGDRSSQCGTDTSWSGRWAGPRCLLLARSRPPPQRLRVAFCDTRPTKAKHPDWYRDDLGTLGELLADGKLHPVIAARIPLEGVIEAHRRVERAEVEGRIVLLPNGEEQSTAPLRRPARSPSDR